MGSPKEVMDWVEASHRPSKDDDKKEYEKKFLKNLHIKFDFNVDHEVMKSSCLLCRVAGLNKIEESFDLFSSCELILRGLAKAKFKNLAKIVVDGKKVYDHPEIKSDLRKTIDDFKEFSKDIKSAKSIEIVAILADVEKATATIRIKKVHSVKEHSVDIQIDGKIRSDVYHTFLNYIDEKIGLKD